MRLQPKYNTLRELYFKSGNQCAFPGCINLLLNSDGEFIGQVCHIEAAEEGGERFNSNQTNEDRRSFDNLILLCYEHHIKTNNTTVYTVDIMKKMKNDHEKKFQDIAMAIGRTITDWTENQRILPAKNIQKLNRVLEYGFEEFQFQPTIDEINLYASKLEQVPMNSRIIFKIILKRHIKAGHGNDYIDPRSIEEVAEIDFNTLDRHISILVQAGLVSNIETDYEDGPKIYLYPTESGWKIWRDLGQFCKKEGLDINMFILDMDFSLLDE